MAENQPTPGGSGLIRRLFILLVVGLAAGVIWWGGCYFIRVLSAPLWALTAWDGLFVLLAIVIVVNFLLSLVGKSFIDL